MPSARRSRELLRRSAKLRRLRMRIRWASLRRTAPLSRWGFERGTPIDRWYIERFLEGNQERVYGRTLEVFEDLYSSRLGATHVDVIDVDSTNPRASIVGDLCEAQTLPAALFDAIVVTQTLQFLARPRDALVNLASALRPGATMLITVPAVSRVADSTDRWRWTPRGMEDLTSGLGCVTSISGAGNALSCRGFLMGLAAEEFATEVLCADDSAFPLIVTARLDKTHHPEEAGGVMGQP